MAKGPSKIFKKLKCLPFVPNRGEGLKQFFDCQIKKKPAPNSLKIKKIMSKLGGGEGGQEIWYKR